MKTYTIYACQEVLYKKTISANSEEDARHIAWVEDNGDNWKEYSFGLWTIDEIKEEKETKQ